MFQISVYGREIEAVVHRHEDGGNDEVTDHISEYHLHIRKLTGLDPTRHRDEGNARKGRTDHPKSNYVPRRFFVADKEGGVAAVLARDVGNQHEYGEVADD